MRGRIVKKDGNFAERMGDGRDDGFRIRDQFVIDRFRRSVVQRRRHEVHDYEQRPWREKKRDVTMLIMTHETSVFLVGLFVGICLGRLHACSRSLRLRGYDSRNPWTLESMDPSRDPRLSGSSGPPDHLSSSDLFQSQRTSNDSVKDIPAFPKCLYFTE